MNAMSVHMGDTLSLDPGIIETYNNPAANFLYSAFNLIVQIGDM
jgi:hypothetical protein